MADVTGHLSEVSWGAHRCSTCNQPLDHAAEIAELRAEVAQLRRLAEMAGFHPERSALSLVSDDTPSQ